jgi:cytochrome c oxidase subunit 3
MASRTLDKLLSRETLPAADGDGRRPPVPGDGGGHEPGSEGISPVATARTGLWIFLVAVTMLFIAFTASYLARRTAPDWGARIALPPILWLNTIVLLASSGVLERARRRWRLGDARTLRGGLLVAAGLGGVFLAGQFAAWRQLALAGVFMRTNPHSAFFYLLTAVHGLHLLGGLGAFGYALSRVASLPVAAGPAVTGGPVSVTAAVEGVGLYWHFLAALWLYVFILLFFL